MGIEDKPIEERPRESFGLDRRIHGSEEDPEEVTPQKQTDTDNNSEIENMARQAPEEISEGIPGG
ncbi:hypothetical protein HYT60_00325 [Candidatus Woesebacteria bacterium]|nr:hypothetical protein [Candidatus Woesebacteria bacterium]